ncbi:hypothetical protein CKN82_07000 [Carnobacterium divergens]|uniref:helix-turn-helix transcriptional regulator n=1 Tax=Carnobacterium divergens TaxID=2748 RepID=UPI001072654B|nr:helix-turn-helix domain-containing protein [Carnobacterium divergens]MDT1995183.1 helix-turn-helix domain-containing protein [Carnobacterium divergens]TFI68781.1 hypothetical protein CKN70_07050 [Carnobacterium divergens]TFI81253.1 hypothetical protein CKN68_07010 [Carnobacterium divergens]TFI88745.1 hypothetical protein CKN72_06880 [Carnobacterium divergens]TFI90116.1 hypothetical protein CKN61_07415 [Carnobacterium divergens]
MAKPKYEKWITDEGLLQLEAWARNGLTDEQIAHNMGVSTATLYNYKRNHLEILEALKKGKEVIDIQVENALLKRALGYSYSENKYMLARMEDDEYQNKLTAYINEYKYNHPEASQEEINRVKINFPKTKEVLVERKTKEVSPDTTAQIFWLKNRKPEQWRDKQVVEHGGEVSVNTAFANLTVEELRRLANAKRSD